MTRRKIQIKKIDSVTARQVTFSKRRKGLFKKAQELSTLCDAEIALLVFSSTGKLFDYASSSMQQVIERYDQHSATQRLGQSPVDLRLQGDETKLSKVVSERTRELRQLHGEELQECTLEELQELEERLQRGLSRVSKTKDERIFKQINARKRKDLTFAMHVINQCQYTSGKNKLQGDENKLSKVVSERTRELRQLHGEELQECTLEELQELEERLQRGLSRVSKTKDERIFKQINARKIKGIQLMEENQRMKQRLAQEQGQSSESIIICSSSDNPPQDCDSSDTSLTLGLSLFK